MDIEIAIRLSGFLLLFIMTAIIASVQFGNKIWDDLDSDGRLQSINNDPTKYKISVVLALIHNVSIIALVIMLFIAFGSYSIIIGIVWITFRTGESLILSYNEKNRWGLLNIAKQYSVTKGAEKNSLSDKALTILKTKDARFKFAQIPFSVGTIAYAIPFVTYGVVPAIIGWFGIVASILYGFGNGIEPLKPNFKVLRYIGSGMIWLFELVFGVWLLFFAHTIL
ncbi:DUF4386 domain-containing protein [Chloroflexota bacterium]